MNIFDGKKISCFSQACAKIIWKLKKKEVCWINKENYSEQ